MPSYNDKSSLDTGSSLKSYGCLFNTGSGGVSCPHCGGKELRKKDRFVREVMHASVNLRPTRRQVAGCKYRCLGCSRYFRERFSGLLPYKRGTEAVRREVFDLHCKGVSQTDLSLQYRISAATVERWFQDFYRRKNRELLQRDCPRVLGIDEHSFSGKGGYATTFCDLSKHRIFDVVQGKSAADLHIFLSSLQGRENVRVVCIDMSASYRSIIRKYFPNAKIVADRFHVIRLIGHHFLKACQAIDPKSKHQRGIVRILRKKPENLTNREIPKLQAYLDEHPAIRAIYDFKQKLHTLLMHKHQNVKQVKTLIPQFLRAINELKASGFQAFRTLGNSLQDWTEEITRMWRFTKSNGITEGFHRKMKLIQRRAYGFRNFENYRLRVKILCG